MDSIIKHLRNAVVALCEERVSEAEQELHAIDFRRLRRDHRAAYAQVWEPGGRTTGFKRRFPGTKRKDPSKAEKQTTFIRDRYTCRYSHCQRPTVSPDVLRLLSRAFAQVLPYHPHWLDRDKHILYYTYSTNIEHLRSFSEIGPSAAAAENLITACYECGDIKNYLTIEFLGWRLTEPPDTDWAGLTEYIPRLLTVIAALEASANETRTA
jgi:5-methylcytosine-specific restriction endonuclease McrA